MIIHSISSAVLSRVRLVRRHGSFGHMKESNRRAARGGHVTSAGVGAARQSPRGPTAYVISVMTHGPGTLTGRTPVTMRVLPSGKETWNVFALTCRTTAPEP